LPELLESVVARLPQGPRYYPADQLSDQQERFIAGELVREAAMRLLEYEVPYASAVLVNEFKERDNGVIYIAATIFVERDSQKGIVIGRNGAMLKRIGSLARTSLEEMFETRVYLELWVKVRKNWRRDADALRDLGYGAP
jgi:GTP-binding protein Era